MKKGFALVFFALVLCFARNICAQTTEFTYQGSLKNTGMPANGNFDFEFALYDALSGGGQVGSTIALNNVVVTSGSFSVKLDFGNQFTGANRYLEIRVRQSGQPGITILGPRQLMNSAPYSVKSLNTDNAAQLGGVPANQYVTTTSGGANFIQNSTTQQASSNFNVSGTGTADILNATTHFSINGNRILAAGGSGNIFAGTGAGNSISSGSANSFFGASAGATNTTGSDNAFFGTDAGFFNSTGSNNTFIGSRSTFPPGSNLTNATALGYRATVATSNALVLGSINGVNGATASTNVGIGTTAPQKTLHVVGQDIRIEAANTVIPRFSIVNSSGPGFNTGKWQNYATNVQSGPWFGNLVFASLNDAEDQGVPWLNVQRNAGTSIDSVTFPSGDFRVSGGRFIVGNTAGGNAPGTLAVFGTNGDFHIDSAGNTGGRFEVAMNGQVGIGYGTNPPNKLTVVDASNTGLRVQNNLPGGNVASFGSNGAFRIDTASTAGGRFSINENGNVGIGQPAPTFKLSVLDTSNTGLRVQTNTTGGTVASFGGNGAFQVDAPGSVAGRFVITEAGNVGINANNPQNKLDVAGIIAVGLLGAAGSTTLCRNENGQIATCSSSLRYKTNIGGFSHGMSFVNKLRPISFDWKDGGMKDIGFAAEDIAKIDPRFVTYNSSGEVEGVKYDRLSVAFVNAFKEQQQQIETQEKKIEALTLALCSLKPDLDICKQK